MTTIPAQTRTRTFTAATASAGPYDVGFRLLDPTALTVYVNGSQRLDFNVAPAVISQFTDAATITFTTPLSAGDEVVIDGNQSAARPLTYLRNDPALVGLLNNELARLSAAVLEIDTQLSRTARGLAPIAPVDGLSALDIANANEAAARAELYGKLHFDTLAALKADLTIGYSQVAVGARIQAGNLGFIVAPLVVADWHLSTANGLLLYADGGAELAAEQFGVDAGNTAAQNDAAFVRAFAWLNAAPYRALSIGSGTFNISVALPTITQSNVVFQGVAREGSRLVLPAASTNSNFLRIGNGVATVARVLVSGLRLEHDNLAGTLAGYAVIFDGASDTVVEDIAVQDVAGVLDVGPTLKCSRLRIHDFRGNYQDALNHRVGRFQRWSGLLMDDFVVYGGGTTYRTVPTFDFTSIGICDTLDWNKVTCWTRSGSQYGVFVNCDNGTFVNADFNRVILDKTGKGGAAYWFEMTAASTASAANFWKIQNVTIDGRTDHGGLEDDDGDGSVPADGRGGRSLVVNQGASTGYSAIRGITATLLSSIRDGAVIRTTHTGTDEAENINIEGCLFRDASVEADGIETVIEMGINDFSIRNCTFGYAERPPVDKNINYAITVTNPAIDSFVITGNLAYCTEQFASEPAYTAHSTSRVIAGNSPVYGYDAAKDVIAWGLVPDNNATATRSANRAYLQSLITADPSKTIVIPQLGTGTIHFNGSLVWPDLYAPQLRMENAAVDLHFWSVDTQTVSYWKSSTGTPITMADGALGGGAVQQTLYFRNSDGKQITQAESVILGGGNFTTAMTANIKANIFWMGSANGRGPRIEGGKITCRYDGDLDKSHAIYLERTKSTATSDAPLIQDVFISRNGSWTAGAFTLKAFDTGFEIRGFASPELRNVAFSGIEPYQAPDGLLPSARFSKAAVYYGDSWNGLAMINPITEASSLFAAKHGILVEGEFAEGGKALSNNIQETDYGVLIDNLAGTSQIWFTVSNANHCNSNIANVLFRGMKVGVVDGNYMAIKRTTGAANTYHVKVEGFATAGAAYRSFGHQITNNTFNAIGVAGTSYGFHGDYCYDSNVSGNLFVSSNVPIYLGANTSGIQHKENKAYIHPQESVAAKLAYVGSSMITDLGAGDLRQVTVTADAAANATINEGGTVIDTAALTANRTRNIFCGGMPAGALVHVEVRTTGGFSSLIRDGLTATTICTAVVNDRVTLRWTGSAFVFVERGRIV